jgi:hypothetical protein
MDAEKGTRMTKIEGVIEQVRKMDHEFQLITGRNAFAYFSSPTPASERWVFADKTCLSGAEALGHMTVLLSQLKSDPRLLPHPYDMPIPESQELPRRGLLETEQLERRLAYVLAITR